MLHYSKTCLKRTIKRRSKIGFHDRLSLNSGQKYCRMLLQVNSIAEYSPLEHSAILLTFIKLPFVIKSFVLSIFDWPLKIGFTVRRMAENGFAPPTLGNFADISYLVEN